MVFGTCIYNVDLFDEYKLREIVYALFKTKLKRYIQDLDRAADGSTKKPGEKKQPAQGTSPPDQTDHKGK